MKQISRQYLSASTLRFLAERTAEVQNAADRAKTVERLWKLKPKKAFTEIRNVLKEMATGLERCMYCEDGQGPDIDHFWPKANDPLRAFVWDNYLLACSVCNSNFKRNQFPLDANGQPLLINPTVEDPLDHLTLVREGQFVSRSEKGKESIKVFGLDRRVLVKGRKDAWLKLELALACYAETKEEGDAERAEKISTMVRQHPFASVLVTLLRAARQPAASLVVHRKCISALERCPEIFSWV